tara:strand:+ start:610 stop:840 length:231 start_codon:yes stop_codon:yes gene_type:complete
MSVEDSAIKSLQSIVKEVNDILSSMKVNRNDSKPMDKQDTAKLNQINDLLLNTKKQILEFMSRYNKQTSLNQFNNN